jgi:hypothetical protein
MREQSGLALTSCYPFHRTLCVSASVAADEPKGYLLVVVDAGHPATTEIVFIGVGGGFVSFRLLVET